jgi:hypothetical protein
MPNRIVRDAILASESVCSLPWAEEVFYRRLMSICDDYGRHEANAQLLRSKCYPLQTDHVRVTDISRWMAACQKAGLILVYEVAGKEFLEIQRFGQQQRSVSKYPSPPSTDSSCNQLIADAHLVVSVVEGVSVVDAGVRPLSYQESFLRFWDAWPQSPRKNAKATCATIWRTKKLDDIADEIIAHVEAMKPSEQWRSGFEPAPRTYLNGRRWEDGAPASKPRGLAT